MCRATAVRGGRRCPSHSDPDSIKARTVRQRIGRYNRRLDAAEAACIEAFQSDDSGIIDKAVAQVDRWDGLVRKALQEHEFLTPPPEPPPSRVGEFTPEATADWTEDQLADAFAECENDPMAREAINGLLLDRWNTEHAEEPEPEPMPVPSFLDYDRETAGPTTTTLPSVRRRKLTRQQELREEYDTYVYCQWLKAEEDCRGYLLNREGMAKGIDPESLFSGNASVAQRYASDELKEWFHLHGRLTFAAWQAGSYDTGDENRSTTKRDRENAAALYRARTETWW